MSDSDLIPTLTRASSTSRSYWRQLNQQRMDGPYPAMPGPNSSQESSRSGNQSSSSVRSRKSSTSKQSSSTTLPGSELMESVDSASLRRPQNRGPRDRSVSEGVVPSSRGRGFGPGGQGTFGDHARAPNEMHPPQHTGNLIHSQASSTYYSTAPTQRNRTRSRERANVANAAYPARHIQYSNPPPISGRHGNQSGNHRPRGGSAGPVRGGRPANPFREPLMLDIRHPYVYDENMLAYREQDRSPDRVNAPHTMRRSNNTESYHSSNSSSRFDKRSVSRSKRPQSEDRMPRRPQSYRTASGTRYQRDIKNSDEHIRGGYATTNKRNTDPRYTKAKTTRDPCFSDKVDTNASGNTEDDGTRYRNRRSYGRSRSSSCVKANRVAFASDQNILSQHVGPESRKYPSSSIFAPPRSRASPIPSNAPSDVDSEEYEYSGESYSESEELHEFPRAGNLTPSHENYYLSSEASMDAVTAYEEYRLRPLPVGNRRRGRRNLRVPASNPIFSHQDAHNNVAHRAEFVRTRRSRSLDSDEERSLRASLSQISSAVDQQPEIVEQRDYSLDRAGNASIDGTELDRDEAHVVEHPHRKYRVLDRSLGSGMGKESRFIQSPIREISLQILHEEWSIIESSVVHEDKTGDFVTASSISDEAEHDLNSHQPEHLSSKMYRASSQTEALGSQNIDYRDRVHRAVSAPCFGTVNYEETAYTEAVTFDTDNTSIASSLRQGSSEVFPTCLLTSRKLTDFFFNYQPETLNHRPGMGIDYDGTCSAQTVGENSNNVVEGYAKPQQHELHDNDDPFTTTPLRERARVPIEHTVNLRAKSAHRRIASEGDSSPYFISQETKPYIQFSIAPQTFKRPNGKQGYTITGVFESFEDKSPSKVPRPLVIRKVSQLRAPPPPAAHYKMSEYVSYSIRRAHTPRKYGSERISYHDEDLSSSTPVGSSSSTRCDKYSGGGDSYYMEYDSFLASPTTPTPARGRMSIAPLVRAGNGASGQHPGQPAISSLPLHDTGDSLSPDFAWVVARPALTTAQQELEAELRATATRKENEKEILAVAAEEKAARVTAAATKGVPKQRLIEIRKSPRKRAIEEAKKKQGTSPSPKIFEASVLERVAVLEKANIDDRCPIMGTHTVRGIESNKRPTVLRSPPPPEKGGYSMIPDRKEYSESSDSDKDETSPDPETSFGHYAVRNRKSYNMPFASPNGSLPNRKPPGAFGGIPFSPTGKRNASDGAGGGSHTPRSPPTAPNNGCFQPPALYPEGANLNADQRARQYEYLEREHIRQATYKRNLAVFGDVKAVEDQRKAVMARQKGMAQCSVCARWREPGTRCCDVKVRHE